MALPSAINSVQTVEKYTDFEVTISYTFKNKPPEYTIMAKYIIDLRKNKVWATIKKSGARN